MGIDPSSITNQVKRLMSKAERKKLGDFAPTTEEVTAKAQHKCEKEMQLQIKAWLDLNDWYYDWDPMHKRRSGKLGTPDFIVCVPMEVCGDWGAKFAALECKMPGNKLSPEQEAARVKIAHRGGGFLVATSAQQALEWLKGGAK